MKGYCYEHSDKGWKPGEECEDCQKAFNTHSSYCRCGQEVTNAAFFKKSSPHFKGTCKRWGEPRGPYIVPEQSWKKPLPYPMPRKPDYSLPQYPQDIEELCKYWGVPLIGDGVEQRVVEFTGTKLPEGEGRWIKALFAGKCLKGHPIQANERAFYYRETRQILCADCGQRAAREKVAA